MARGPLIASGTKTELHRLVLFEFVKGRVMQIRAWKNTCWPFSARMNPHARLRMTWVTQPIIVGDLLGTDREGSDHIPYGPPSTDRTGSRSRPDLAERRGRLGRIIRDMRPGIALGMVVAAALVLSSTTVRTQSPAPKPVLYVVATSHLDSQWNWTVQDSIRRFVPATVPRELRSVREVSRLRLQL
jgi:hypothetical protein